MTFIIHRCSFTSNVLRSAKTVEGGGAYIHFYGAARLVLLMVTSSTFEHNLLIGEDAQGGGLKIYSKDATDTHTTFDHCTFRYNMVHATVHIGQSGAISLGWKGSTASGVRTDILHSTFVGNRITGADNLWDTPTGANSNVGVVNFDVYLYATSSYSADVLAVVDGCSFLNNYAFGNGGAISGYSYQAGFSLHVLRSVIRGNRAKNGGGIFFNQGFVNPPSNLAMNVTYRYGTIPPHKCRPTFSADGGYAREYAYSSDLVIDTCTISNNSAVSYLDDQPGSGGAVCVTNANVTIRSSAISSNQADGTGGAIALMGSARLTLEGNTSLRENTANKAGTAIYSSSAGSIAISDETSVQFCGDAGTSGIAILSGGILNYSAGDALIRASINLCTDTPILSYTTHTPCRHNAAMCAGRADAKQH
jgi:hypothetical protein